MRYTLLSRLVRLTACSGLLTLCGCYNMNGYVLNASGLGYYEQGNYAVAAQEFETALANTPQNPDYMSNLAKARMKMGDQATAERLFRQSLVISPSHQPSYHGLAEMMLAQGRGQEAQQLVSTWAGAQPYIAEPHVELAWLQRELGQHDAAAQSLQAALQVNPNHSTALAHLGQHYQDTGQTNRAIAMYQQSLRANWEQPEVQSRLAVAAAAAGPNHPMGEIAMARGVHPHSVPQTQVAFGPRVQPQMIAQTQFPQPQFAQAPMMPQPQIAYQPQPPGPPQFYGRPPQQQQIPAAWQQAFNPMGGMPLGIGMASGPVVTSPATLPTPSTTQAAPVPDPAFVGSSGTAMNTVPIPVTAVSQTVAQDPLPQAIEAF